MSTMTIFKRNSGVHNVEEIIMTNGSLQVTVVPEANMVISSFKKDGKEILGQRFGLEGYIEKGKAFGIPFLSPWANRVTETTYNVENYTVTFNTEGMKTDENGYANHGLMTAIKGWRISSFEIGDEIILEGYYKFDSQTPNFKSYPFKHDITITYILTKNSLEVITKINNSGDKTLPIAFGWHPHFNTTVEQIKTNGVSYNIPLSSKCLPLEEFDSEDTDPTALMFKMNKSWSTEMITESGLLKMTTNNYPYMLQWNPPEYDFVAVEPMTANIDPFKNSPTLLKENEEYIATFKLIF